MIQNFTRTDALGIVASLPYPDRAPAHPVCPDSKRLCGERGFDYANLFCNPDVGDASTRVAVLPDRFAKRLAIVAEHSGIERRRLLQWIVAWTGLSVAWFLGDGQSPAVDFRIAALALAELDR
jgi:streptomycin 6-kinase